MLCDHVTGGEEAGCLASSTFTFWLVDVTLGEGAVAAFHFLLGFQRISTSEYFVITESVIE